MSFYEVLAQLSVTLLGLWWVVVQVRESRAPSDADERRLASAVSLHLAVPALMSLCSLADPDHNALWRWSFGALGTFGLVHLVATAARRPGAVTGLGPVGPVAVGLGVSSSLQSRSMRLSM